MVVNKKEEQELQKQQAATYQQTPYQESDLVKQAQTMIQNQLAQKPGQYQSPWQTQLNDVIGKVMNREKFSYDLNADALYKQYADKFITQGKMAMMDTMGQAQAMTGGYGNSYAQNVGQQAYQGQLQQLNDKIPELYQLALSKYQTEGGQLMDQFSILGAMEDQAYGRYLDDRNFGYQQYRDQVADEQWQKEYAESIRRFDFKNKLGEFAPKETPKPAGQPYQPPETEPEVDEDKIISYVKRMLDNATSSQFNPDRVIDANSSLTADEKKFAKEVVSAYIKSGYMKF